MEAGMLSDFYHYRSTKTLLLTLTYKFIGFGPARSVTPGLASTLNRMICPRVL